MVHYAFGSHGIGLVLRNPPERGVGFDAPFLVLNPKIGINAAGSAGACARAGKERHSASAGQSRSVVANRILLPAPEPLLPNQNTDMAASNGEGGLNQVA